MKEHIRCFPRKSYIDLIKRNIEKQLPQTVQNFFCKMSFTVSTKKDVRLENCELSFIWGKMRTTAWEAASQIALRDFSKVAMGEIQYIRFW